MSRSEAAKRGPDGTASSGYWEFIAVQSPHSFEVRDGFLGPDGKANDELVALLARHFGCRRSAVLIKSGASGRLKLVRIDGD